ncbi:MAG: acetyltransferase [Candidatus Methylomirabilales bacterium]
MAEQIKVVGIGAGGHAKILIELLEQTGKYELVGFTDAHPERWGKELMGYPVLGDDETLAGLYAKGVRTAFIGVGAVSSAGTRLRAKLFHQTADLGFQMLTLIHPKAAVSPSATIGVGSVVMAGAVVSADVRVGDNVAIYSGTVIEHDSVIDNHVHMSPGVQLAGGVHIEEGAFIGIGASIIQGIRVGRWTTIGAGTVVLKDLPDNVVAVGVPARPVREMSQALPDSD